MVIAFILGGVIGAVSGAAVAGGLAARGGGSGPAAVASPVPEASEDSPAADESTTPGFSYADAGLSLDLKTTKKQCFGSAGCNVSVRVEMSVNDPSTIPDDATGTVTFEVNGGEDGALTDTIDIVGSKYSIPEETVSTASSSKKLTVKIVDVSTN